jgi:type VI secretion system protein ImpF|tara:strand:+ start:1129 stop:1545 length:417 start_codon:yes stop_codon:yes gene_type:complete
MFSQTFLFSSEEAPAADTRADICRNIQALLESEAAFSFHEDGGVESSASIAGYGLEGIALFSRLNSGEQIAFRLREKIMTFEPRLADLEVTFIASQEASNKLGFEFSALVNQSDRLNLNVQIDTISMSSSVEEDYGYF